MEKLLRKTSDGGYNFWCPGCKCVHHIDNRWKNLGTLDNPTIRPSVQVSVLYDEMAREDLPDWIKIKANQKRDWMMNQGCHLFITNGRIEYLKDSTHELSGKTIDMVTF